MNSLDVRFFLVISSKIILGMDKASRHDRMIDYDGYKKCVTIPKNMSLCIHEDLPYSKMTLPNLQKDNRKFQIFCLNLSFTFF